MRKLIRPAIALAALLPLAAAAAQETRTVGDFTEIGLAAPVDVHVTQGEPASLVLEGNPEALARIETVVEGGRLKIRTKDGGNWGWKDKVKARVTTRQVNALAIAGSGDITAPAITGEALKVSIAGSGDVRVGGKVDGLTASISGSGEVRAGELDAQSVKVSIAGSGDATVRAQKSLTVSVSGSGDVRYFGDPTVQKSIMGSGSVRRAGAASS
jgi:hypothetical protein